MPLVFKDAPMRWLVPLLAGILLIIGLAETPPGLLGKMDALAYSVCHRLAGHSFFLEDRAMPLCARCSGMYLGILTGLIYLLPRRQVGYPSRGAWVSLGFFVITFTVDGINSFVDLAYHSTLFYQPQNIFRVLTGALVGTGMAAILAPAFHQTVWKDVDTESTATAQRVLLLLAGASMVLGILLWLQNPLITYPLAVASGCAVLLFLVLIHTTVWVMVLKRWNSFTSWGGITWILLLGVLSSLIQVFSIDLGRYSLTGTWAGIF